MFILSELEEIVARSYSVLTDIDEDIETKDGVKRFIDCHSVDDVEELIIKSMEYEAERACDNMSYTLKAFVNLCIDNVRLSDISREIFEDVLKYRRENYE